MGSDMRCFSFTHVLSELILSLLSFPCCGDDLLAGAGAGCAIIFRSIKFPFLLCFSKASKSLDSHFRHLGDLRTVRAQLLNVTLKNLHHSVIFSAFTTRHLPTPCPTSSNGHFAYAGCIHLHHPCIYPPPDVGQRDISYPAASQSCIDKLTLPFLS